MSAGRKIPTLAEALAAWRALTDQERTRVTAMLWDAAAWNKERTDLPNTERGVVIFGIGSDLLRAAHGPEAKAERYTEGDVLKAYESLCSECHGTGTVYDCASIPPYPCPKCGGAP